MKNANLSNINFREIIDYGGQPKVQNRYDPPLRCSGYCISCEESDLLNGTDGKLDLMSHGCDSSDFESLLGPMPREASEAAAPLHEPVLFVLEDPGGDYNNGAPVEFRKHHKLPPVNHYYWTPNMSCWPRSPEEFKGNFYGPYLAYLMWRHQLSNAYITNLIKCRFRLNGSNAIVNTPPAIEEHCTQRFLAKEVSEFRPRLVFCFGGQTERKFRKFRIRAGMELNSPSVNLLHPSYIANRCQAHGRTAQQCVEENDSKIRNAMQAIQV